MGLIYTSTIIVFLCVFIGGSLTRIYGNYCGIDIFNISTWSRAFLLHGSPLCKFLNLVSYYSHYILENLYIYVLVVIVSKVNNLLPFQLFSNTNRPRERSASL